MKISPTFLTRLPFQVWEMNFVAGFCTYNVLPLIRRQPDANVGIPFCTLDFLGVDKGTSNVIATLNCERFV